LENFAKVVHGSLHLTEVGYHVVNEGRRLVEVDRVSVAVRQGYRPQVVAISGADVVEKRSNLVQLMRALFEQVIDWGEKLVYSGAKDEALPPKVLKALDAYLAESNSKFLVVMPLPDEREVAAKKKPRSAIMMECFETGTELEQKIARLEVIGRHATTALYNAAEYRRIPMRFLWLPLAKVQDGLGGKAQAIVTLIGVGIAALLAAMVFVPYPLRMAAPGTFQPKERLIAYSPVEAQVREIAQGLKSGSRVTPNQELIRLYSLELRDKIRNLQGEIAQAKNTIDALSASNDPQDKIRVSDAKLTRDARLAELMELANFAKASLQDPGTFWIKSPIPGIILTPDFREQLTNKPVKPNEPLLKIGRVDPLQPRLADWEIELKIPQKHIGQVLRAFPSKEPDAKLDVDILLKTMPTSVFKGKLRRDKIALEAKNQRDVHDEPEPVVLAWVRLDDEEIPEAYRVPLSSLLSSTEVETRIRCGNRAMGYSLFYGVWEFIYEKIVFFF
ncbi:MAG: hypothetical protein NZO58_13340, partial [Gemmataceae bacterium]|nr:hypothetical protein [Gemmataceae bacterium]